MFQFEYNQIDQNMYSAKYICYVDLEGKQKQFEQGDSNTMDGCGGGLSFGHLSNLRQIEARKRLFETKLKIMDNEVVKFTCFRNQIPAYFTKLARLDDIERASKEFKSL